MRGSRRVRHASLVVVLSLLVVGPLTAPAPVEALGGGEAAVAIVSSPDGMGYAIVNKTAKQYNYGSSAYTGGVNGPTNIVDAASRPGGSHDKWFVGADGGIFGLNAPYYGSLPGLGVTPNRPITAIVPSGSGNGYLLVGEDGGTFGFGDYPYPGSLAGQALNAPIVDAAQAPSGGTWLVASDGGVFAMNGAPFYGSMGGQWLNAPIVAIVAAGGGYHLVGADGGVFSFNVGFPGSFSGQPLNQPIVEATAVAGEPNALWLIAADGGVFALNAGFYGSAVGELNPAPQTSPPTPTTNPGNIAVGCHGGGSITVASSIAGNLRNLLDAAHNDGLNLCGSGWRSSERQIELRRQNCGPTYYDIYQRPSGECSPPTARPGSSMHERGLAIDFGNCSTQGTTCFQWLNGHASSYGLHNLPSEAWHWSTTGN